ncbi:helix-turn-helix domain-containing protein [Geomonas sp. RF6]|uniref:helix-turn-helix transcriptional regulator n=1 Tax=Geomonas sp. RF6 TaxID=2897342 RepID=UPI001E3295F2|nr:helix-turn-helix transcriptional regulator [Geomonas sp. RF6]UFS72171.1 helix-turn-helix domain-containing protein [Geomonas sp. RF6]
MEKSPEKTEKGAQPSIAIDGNRLKQVRETKKLTQLYVASVVGVTTDTISRWENNRYPSMRRDNALKLAAALEVELDEIVRQEEEPPAAADPAPEPTPSRPLLFRVAIAVLLAIGLAVALARILFTPPIAVRWTPRYAAPGSIIPVQIKVGTVREGTQGFLIRETLPPGWMLVSALPPPAAVEANGGAVKWLVTGRGSGQTVSYTVQIPPNAPQKSETTVKGQIVVYAKGSSHSEKIAGDSRLTVGDFHWADLNGDRRIDDDEIMPAYYVCEAMKGLRLDWKIIEAIWSAKGYRWDPRDGYQPVR